MKENYIGLIFYVQFCLQNDYININELQRDTPIYQSPKWTVGAIYN